MKRVLHLLPSNHFSGAENVICQIMSMFRDDPEYDMIYCSPDGQIREALAERQLPFLPLKCFSFSEIRRVIRTYQPDVIHTHDMKAAVYAAVVCGNTSLISHIHNNGFDSRKINIKSVLFALAALRIKHIFWVSRPALLSYRFHSLLKSKSSVLQNIVDIKSIQEKMQLDKNSYDYDIVYLGRLTYPKNPLRLIDVLEMIIRQKNDVKIAIIGNGDLEESARDKAAEKKLLDNIHFLGFQSNPYKILHDSKLMIMTSLWEGLPMCALEAMALGVPIVSTPADGLCDVIEHGKTGFLERTDQKLADSALCLLEDEQLQKRISSNAAIHAQHLMNLDVYKETLIQAYDI